MHNIRTRLIIFGSDFIALSLALILSYHVSGFLSEYIPWATKSGVSSQNIQDRLVSYSLLASVVLFALFNRGHYRRRIPWWSQVRYLLMTISIMLLVDGFLHFAAKYPFSRLWIVLSWSMAFILILLCRFITRALAGTFWNVPTIVIGNGQNVVETLFAIHSDKFTGYQVHSLILHEGASDFERRDLPAGLQDIDIIECDDSHYQHFIHTNTSNFYIIAPDAYDDLNMQQLVNTLESRNVNYAIIPPIKGLSLYGLTPQYFFGHDTMFLTPRPAISSPFGKLVKRGIDVVGSGAALIVLSPLFIVFALMIRRDGGSAFYSQPRIGLHENYFRVLKFRSMCSNAEEVLHELLASDAQAKAAWETHRKLKKDPRVTKVGSILRKTSLDELPQLINVLKGDMSLVGPRPILEDEKEFFEEEQYRAYCSAKPGITGLWQVSGRNETTYKQRVHLDTWYVKNWSLYHDIVILFKTIGVIFQRLGAY